MAPSSSSKGKAPMKQGNLFSFFGKKPPAASKTAAASTTGCQSSQSSAALPPPSIAPQMTKAPPGPASTSHQKKAPPPPSSSSSSVVELMLGSRIEVYWSDDAQWYAAEVSQRRNNSSFYYLSYDDGTHEWLDLSTERYRQSIGRAPHKKQRRLIINDDDDDDEGENEFDMDLDDDDDEEYNDDDNNKANNDGKAAAEEEDDWMVTDDEDDAEISGKNQRSPASAGRSKERRSSNGSTKTNHKKVSSSLSQFSAGTTTTNSNNKKKKVQVTEHAARRSSTSSSSSSAAATPASSSSSTQQRTPLARATPRQITPTDATTRHSPSPPQWSSPHPKDMPKQQNNNGTQPPPYVEGAVNPEGSHVHNHLPFLRQPKDARGRSRDDPNYDPRTLLVQDQDWQKIMGKKMTDAVKQWWDLKSQYFDTVLLFKTGKFYEMFHMDADVGVQVLHLKYMKGHVAHSGFPESAYGTMADKLVRAGYKVARVEQTETPEMLKERKTKGSPKVVNREVCSVLTIGTRTFCYLDDTSTIDAVGAEHSPDMGPLLAIREILLEPSSSSSGDGTAEDQQPVCEYGITIVDAVRGSVTLGQFADDVLRSRMATLLTAYAPSEILVEGGDNGVSPTLLSLLRAMQSTSQLSYSIEAIRQVESFPQSTALDKHVRQQLERNSGSRFRELRPWNVEETLEELHRRKYYPCGSKTDPSCKTVTRWPPVLRAAVEGNAELALSSFGAALFYLQRNLIDAEMLSMGLVKAYVPPESCVATERSPLPTAQLEALQAADTAGVENVIANASSSQSDDMNVDHIERMAAKAPTHMALDGTTLHNLEVLSNSVDHKVAGSLWSKINYTKTPHGARLLRAWLLRPLFQKADIERRLDAVQELVSGSAAAALADARSVLSKCGDFERLLSRVHSMSGTASAEEDGENDRIHPNERAILYEMPTYTKRKVGDFSKLLSGLQAATQIPELFNNITINSGLLRKVVHSEDNGGCFPSMAMELEWFFNNFDCDQAAKGLFEPSRGMDDQYDEACDASNDIMNDLNAFKDEMCLSELSPPSLAKSSWKYVNTKPDSKDKYLIELPARVTVPDHFIMKGKRGSGQKQINKYRTPEVERLVQDLEKAYEIQRERKARGMELVFMKFDSKRTLWAAAAQATALLDALGSLAHTASKPGYCRPIIVDAPPEGLASINITQGRHPCVESNAAGADFIPNDLSLGNASDGVSSARVLLLSGPNMGGKSTLLRQTCLITIMAQLGSFVPAESCELTPLDRIFTRLGASDRILMNQSTFFVELAETAAALRGATHRSLVIMDELGRGTSTFDGTAIASATVKHLVENNQCLSLFATHYHSVLDEWQHEPKVRLGHMQCLVEKRMLSSSESNQNQTTDDNSITFLYTLGEGTCPKSFGINVAQLAGLPDEVLRKAKQISSTFEAEQAAAAAEALSVSDSNRADLNQSILAAIDGERWDELIETWNGLQK